MFLSKFVWFIGVQSKIQEFGVKDIRARSRPWNARMVTFDAGLCIKIKYSWVNKYFIVYTDR